jgi:hypothetical protein
MNYENSYIGRYRHGNRQGPEKESHRIHDIECTHAQIRTVHNDPEGRLPPILVKGKPQTRTVDACCANNQHSAEDC